MEGKLQLKNLWHKVYILAFWSKNLVEQVSVIETLECCFFVVGSNKIS